MPELPEVEVRRRFMERHAVGRRITDVALPDATVLADTVPEAFRDVLAGTTVRATHRHGKWLFARLDSAPWLWIHFGMTGSLRLYQGEAPRFIRLSLRFSDGNNLAFTDPRKFGAAGLADDVDAFLAARGWGPDPTHPGFDLAAFRARLKGRTGNLKGVLLNQKVIAGIGNLYADEMLFQAGLHPETRCAGLKPVTVRRLYEAMMTAFEASLAVETRYHELPDSFLLRHRNHTSQCPKCRGTLKIHKAAGRSTYYCPRHQRRRG